MHLDVGRRPDLLFGHCDVEVIGTDMKSGERYEGQVTVDEAFLDRDELRLVGLDVHVDVLQLADLLAIAIHEHLAVPFGGIPFGLALIFGHLGLPVSGPSLSMRSSYSNQLGAKRVAAESV